MPIKMVTCEICAREVTRRSTYSLSRIGIGRGRGCKSHDVVISATMADIIRTQSRTLKKIFEKDIERSAIRAHIFLVKFNSSEEEVVEKLKKEGASVAIIEKIMSKLKHLKDVVPESHIRMLLGLREN